MSKKRLRKLRKKFLKMPLPAGESRAYKQCRQCGHLWVLEYIPYAIGRGRLFNPCHCYLTGNDKAGHETLHTESAHLCTALDEALDDEED